MEGDRILLVDDEKEFIQALAQRLEVRGLKVDLAFDGEEALQMAGRKAYDAVILDLAMPGLDGVETLGLLRSGNDEIQVIVLTGHATVAKATEAMKLGAVDLLQKPVPLRKLIEKIEESSSRRAILVERHMEEKLKDILGKKGW